MSVNTDRAGRGAPVYALRLPQSIIDRLHVLAEERGTRPSRLARAILMDVLDQVPDPLQDACRATQPKYTGGGPVEAVPAPIGG